MDPPALLNYLLLSQVGLYAKWGSGKSFLLKKLREEMQSFAREWVDPTFHLSPLLFCVVFHVASSLGVGDCSSVLKSSNLCSYCSY